MADVLAGTAGEAYSHWTQAFGATAAAFSSGNIQPDSANSKTWAKEVYLSLTGGGLSFTFDGTTPTASLGHAFTAGDEPLTIVGPVNIQNFRAVANGGAAGDPKLHITAIRDQK